MDEHDFLDALHELIERAADDPEQGSPLYDAGVAYAGEAGLIVTADDGSLFVLVVTELASQ